MDVESPGHNTFRFTLTSCVPSILLHATTPLSSTMLKKLQYIYDPLSAGVYSVMWTDTDAKGCMYLMCANQAAKLVQNARRHGGNQ